MLCGFFYNFKMTPVS